MTEQTTVMMAHAQVASRELASRVLRRWGFYEVLEASDGEKALALISPELKIAVIEWTLPRCDVLRLCRRLKSDGPSAHRYVIVTFPTVEADEILDALAAGADDYTIEPVNPDDLLERVVVGQRALKLAPWASDDDSDVQARPYRDALTGLATRDCFLKRLREELRRARRERAPLAIAMIDLDGFRRVNEVYGRSVGDEILRQLGKMLADGVRQGTDLAARYGGEEFAVIVPNTNMIGAKAMADRLRKEALLIRVCTERGCVAVAASVGVAVFGRRFWGLDDPVGALIEAAQRRLYQAKLQGGNCMAA